MVRLNEAAIASLALIAGPVDALPGLDRRQFSFPGINVLTGATPAPTANVVEQVDCWVFGGFFWGACKSSSVQAQLAAAATKSTVTVRTGVLTTTISGAVSQVSSTGVAPLPSASTKAPAISKAPAATAQHAVPALSSAIAHSNFPVALSLAGMIQSMAPSIPAASGNLQIQSVAGALTSAIKATNLQQASTLVLVLNSMAPASTSAAAAAPVVTPAFPSLNPIGAAETAACYIVGGLLFGGCVVDEGNGAVSTQAPQSTVAAVPALNSAMAQSNLGEASHLAGVINSAVLAIPSTSAFPLQSAAHGLASAITASNFPAALQFASILQSAASMIPTHSSASFIGSVPGSVSQSGARTSTHSTSPAPGSSSGPIASSQSSPQSSSTIAGGQSSSVHLPGALTSAIAAGNNGQASSVASHIALIVNATPVPGASQVSQLASALTNALANSQFGQASTLAGVVDSLIPMHAVSSFSTSYSSNTLPTSTVEPTSQVSGHTSSAPQGQSTSSLASTALSLSSQAQTVSASSSASSSFTRSEVSAAPTSAKASGASSEAQTSSISSAVSTTTSIASEVQASTNAAPASSSSVPGAAQSCTANGVTYQNGQQIDGYAVHCSQDNSQPGSVTFPVQNGGFSKCPAACEAQPGCIGWTYSGNDSGNCYLKTSEGTYSTATSYVVSGFKNYASPNGSVPSSVTSSSSLSSTSTQAALSSLSTQSSISTISVQSGSSTALASSAAQSISSSSVLSTSAQTATVITLPGGSLFTIPAGVASSTSSSAPSARVSTVSSGNASALPSASPSGVSTSATGTFVTITLGTIPSQSGSSRTSSATAFATSAPCDQLGNGSQFNGFKIACNTDAPGSDIGTVSATSFADCIGRCTAFVGCSSFSFVGGNGAGTCYLKNRYVPSASNPSNADSGFISDPSQASRSSRAAASTASISDSVVAQQTVVTLPNNLGVTPSPIPTDQTSFFAGSPYTVTLANGQAVTGQVATGPIVPPFVPIARTSSPAQSGSSVVFQETLMSLPNGQIVTRPTASISPSSSVVSEQGSVITLPNGQITTIPGSSARATLSVTDANPTAVTLLNGQVVTFPARSRTASSSASANVVTLTMSSGNVVAAPSFQASSISFVAELTTVTLVAGSGSGSSAATVSSLSSAATSVASCSANGVTYQSGREVDGYILHCSQDNSQPGSTVIPVQNGGFSQCPAACDAQAGCIGWTYSGDDGGNCYLKTAEGTYSTAPTYVVSGFKNSASQASASSSQSLSSDPGTSSLSSSSLTTVTSPSASNAQPSSSGQSITVTLPAASSMQASGPRPTSSSVSNTDCEALSGNQGLAEFVDSSGYLYNITCKHDIPGGDIGAVSSPTFESCFSKCDTNARCVGFSWLQDDGPGTCYLKGSQGNTIATSAADVAVKVGFAGTQSGVSANAPDAASSIMPSQSGAVTSVVLSTVLQAQTPSAPASAVTSFFSSAAALTTLPVVLLAPTNVAASCQQLGNGSQAGQYTNRCGTDAIGGDFMNIQADSFAGCGPLCDAQPQCIGYAYVGGNGPGTCYLKSTQEPASTNSNVDIAFKPAAGNVLSTSVLSSGAGSTSMSNTPTTPTATHTITSIIPPGVIPGATGEVPITVLPSGAPVPSGNVPIMTVSGFVVAAPITALPSTFLRTSAALSTLLTTTQGVTPAAASPTRAIPSDETSWFSAANTAGNGFFSTSTAVHGPPGSSSIIGTSTVHAPATPNVAIDTLRSMFTASDGGPGSITIIGTTTITALTTPSIAVPSVTLSASSNHAQSLPASGVILGVGTVPISLISSGRPIPSGHAPIGTWDAGAVVVAPISAFKTTASVAAHASAAPIDSTSAHSTPSRAINSVVTLASTITVTLGRVSNVPSSIGTAHPLSAALSSVAAQMSTVSHNNGPAISSMKSALTSIVAATSTRSVPGHDIDLGPAVSTASQLLNSFASAESGSAPQSTLKGSVVVVLPAATTSYFPMSVVSSHQVTFTGSPIVSTVADGKPTAVAAAAPAPSGPPMIIDAVKPVTDAGATQCDMFQQSKDEFHYLKATVLYGNKALDGAFLAAPTVPGHEVARLTHNQTIAAETIYEPTTRSYFVRGDDSIMSREGTCQYDGLALISHPMTEPGPVGLVPGSATTGATGSIDGVCSFAGLPAPYSFGTWYACDGDMALKYLPHSWHKGGVQNVDYKKCAAVILHQFDLYN